MFALINEDHRGDGREVSPYLQSRVGSGEEGQDGTWLGQTDSGPVQREESCDSCARRHVSLFRRVLSSKQ